MAPPPQIANPSGSEQAAPTPVPTALPGGATDAQGAGADGGKSTQVSSGSTLIDKLNQLFAAGNTPSVQGRLNIFSNTIDGWIRHPVLGWGSGAYPLIYPPDYTGAYWIANLELHILFDTGTVGLILFAIPVIVAARRGARALRGPKVNWSTTQFIVLGLLIAGAGLLFAYQITDATWMGFTWVFLALLVMATRFAAQAKAQAGTAASMEADAR
jgi:O-antigen ligase